MEFKDLVSFEDYFKSKHDSVLIDVRSPVEHMHGHIPGAHNIPLFTNEERAVIGTIYKQLGKTEAIEKGLSFVSPNLLSYVTRVKEIAKDKKVFVHCFRGGMRSKNFAWLLQTAGFNVQVLQGGYKKFRQLVLQTFLDSYKLVVIGGATGSAKTAVLRELKQMNYQVVDLEALAEHKGSSFGSINEKKQPSQQNFENLLFDHLRKFDIKVPIFIEDEAFNIGRIAIPHAIWQKMKTAPILVLEIDAKYRVKQIVSDYATADTNLLKAAFKRIKDSIGGLAYRKAFQFIEENAFEQAAMIALAYYDKAYSFNHEKRFCRNIYILPSDTIDAKENAKMILEYYLQHQHQIWTDTNLWQQKLNLQTTAKAQGAVVK
jgi:tRNA 2-selenouridine synthase